MPAPIDFASRFTTSDDPAHFLRALMGASGNGAATADDVFADEDASDDPAPSTTSSAPDDDGAGGKGADGKGAGGNGTPAPKSGREANGTFAKGNPGGPGNPFNRQVARLRQQLIDSMTPAVFQQAIAALVIKACSGEMAALKLLFQYTLGKPAEAVHPDRVALDEAELARDCNNAGRQWRDLTGAPFLETLMKFFRFFQVVATEKFENRFAAGADEVIAAQEKTTQQAEARRARAEARRAQKAEEAAAATEAAQTDVAGKAVSNPAGPPAEPTVAPPSANGSDRAAAIDVVTETGEPAALATGVQAAAAEASSGRSHAAAAPSPNRPDGVPAPVADSKKPSDAATTAPPDAANRGKTKAPPLTNGTDGRPPDGQQSGPGVPRPTRSAKRKTRAA